MEMIGIKSLAGSVIKTLQAKHPAFLIESHLQYEFALELWRRGYDCHLEYQMHTKKHQEKEAKYRVDLLAIDHENKIGYIFEFKYCTEECNIKINEKLVYHLKKQAGAKQRRKAIWKDIEKLNAIKTNQTAEIKALEEKKIADLTRIETCFVLITNDKHFLNFQKGKSESEDNSDLCVAQGYKFNRKIINTELQKDKKELTINVGEGEYVFEYVPYNKDYTKYEGENKDFQMLILEI